MSEIAKYSRFVSRLKILLPLGGGAILLAVVIWPFISSKKEAPLTNIDESSPAVTENRMLKPRYASTDKKGRPFEIEAEWGKPSSPSTKVEEADLITPSGRITTEQHGDVILNAKHGHYDKEKNYLELDTEVVLETEDGYHFATEKADVDIDKKIVEGRVSIKGHGPKGEFQARDGFRLEETKDGNNIMTLKGPSRIVINPDALKKVKVQ